MKLPKLLGILLMSALLLCGVLSVECKDEGKPKSGVSQTLEKGRKKQVSTSTADTKKGMSLYKAYQCAACHSIKGQGCKDGMPLDGVGTRRSEKFLFDQLKDPEEHVRKNPKAFGADPINLMPSHDLDAAEIKVLCKYLQTLK